MVRVSGSRATWGQGQRRKAALRRCAPPRASTLTSEGPRGDATIYDHRGSRERREREPAVMTKREKRANLNDLGLGFTAAARSFVLARSADDHQMVVDGLDHSGQNQPMWASEFLTQAQVAA